MTRCSNQPGGPRTEFTYTYPDTGETVGLASPFPDLPVNENNTQYTDKSTALYAEVTWHATQQWAFTLGGRYTHDAIDDQVTGLVAFGTPQASLYGNSSYNDFSPRLVATFKPTTDQMLYGTVSHGYKAGGNDLNAALPEQNKPFAPEKVWNCEVGYKSEWWDHKALLNASVFYLQWKDLQSEVNYLAVPGDISSAVQVTENASSATTKGAELEAQVRPIKPLTFGVAVGYLDAKFGSFPNAVIYGVPVDLSGRPCRSPRSGPAVRPPSGHRTSAAAATTGTCAGTRSIAAVPIRTSRASAPSRWVLVPSHSSCPHSGWPTSMRASTSAPS